MDMLVWIYRYGLIAEAYRYGFGMDLLYGTIPGLTPMLIPPVSIFEKIHKKRL